VQPVTAHVVRVASPPPEPGQRPHGCGRAWIDHGVPRGPQGSPWIVRLEDGAEGVLADEIRSLGFELIVGVDTGGDSIARKRGRGPRGRDQRMLGVLRQTGVPLLHVVVAPGSDGEASWDDLRSVFQEHAAAGRYRGCFALGPILPVLRALGGNLSPTRTPQLILAAAEGRLARTDAGRVVVPRGRKPAVPASWLTTAFVFTPPP
jgi:Protein of unknown function (DUF1152)